MSTGSPKPHRKDGHVMSDGAYCDEINASLKDGSAVLIRQIRPEDKELLKIGMSHLSPASRHFRFFAIMKELPESLLDRLVEIDHVNHDAWGALDENADPPEPVGVARYVRLPDNDRAAETAVTVTDSYQGRGLGTLLLAITACRALENGIDEFVAYVLTENDRMLELFSELNAVTRSVDAGEIELRIPLQSNPARYPSTPVGKVFRNVAETAYPWRVRPFGLP